MAWELPGNIGTNPPTDFLGTTDAQPLSLKTNGAEHVRLDVTGNLGIGTTTPEARLHIHSPDNDALKVTNTAVGKSLRIGVDQLGAWLEPTEQNSSIRLNANPSLVGLLIDGQTGNVGIGTGTTTPGSRLHIHSPDNDALKVTNTAVGKTLRIGVDQLGSWLEPTEQNSSIRLNANPTLVGLLIDGQTGHVGIGTGTTTPQSMLEVQATGVNVAVSGHSDQFVGIQGTSVAGAAVFGRSTNGAGVYAESVSDVGVYATTASNNNNVIRAISSQYTEVPQVLIEADNTLPGAFARLRMRQTNTAPGGWDIAVGGATDVMNFDWASVPGTTVLSLSSNGDATVRGALRQNSSRALKDQIHDLAGEEAIDALQSLNPVQFTLKSDREAKRRLGFISEELPDLVASPDRATVSPMDIIAVLTKVVQAQQQSLTALTHKIDGLQRRLA